MVADLLYARRVQARGGRVRPVVCSADSATMGATTTCQIGSEVLGRGLRFHGLRRVAKVPVPQAGPYPCFGYSCAVGTATLRGSACLTGN